ncbi:RNA polymerase sigma factor WhiG [Geodia barretti]|uniref:RNA polymerase sigma factor WhiG n=1 Tax=Geodia barretti TaxID=519541 RepID=A0AA35TTJ1_GEOBA|nr:RNA polymerase sigma factor WhiG [Geodia barretti]
MTTDGGAVASIRRRRRARDQGESALAEDAGERPVERVPQAAGSVHPRVLRASVRAAGEVRGGPCGDRHAQRRRLRRPGAVRDVRVVRRHQQVRSHQAREIQDLRGHSHQGRDLRRAARDRLGAALGPAEGARGGGRGPRLEASLGRAATDEEIAVSMGVSVEEFQRILVRIAGTAVVSVNDVWHGGEDEDRVSIEDNIESPSESGPATIAEREEMRRVIVEAINELPENEQQVLALYYYEELTLKEIGQVLEVTESRVSQLHTKARLRLRTKLTNVKRGI